MSDARRETREIRFLSSVDMGNYEQAVCEFLHDQTAHSGYYRESSPGRHTYGFGFNFEQNIAAELGVLGRLGWSDGHNESFDLQHVNNPGYKHGPRAGDCAGATVAR